MVQFHHLEKYEFVNGVRMTSIIYEMENKNPWFETTNQLVNLKYHP